MSTDAGSAAAPEDAATREVASERPGLESGDPESADSATSTPETADRGVEGSAHPDAGSGGHEPEADAASSAGTGAVGADDSESGEAGANPADEGFVASMLRDATITGLPGDTGAPPAEPHAPQAQQQGDEPVGSEPEVGDNPRGVD
jgi:hypothetical protein